MKESQNHFDVIIVGAGLSGIGAAHHLTTKCPNHSFAILEARERIGGTWDLFKYPGIRSDSDMYTMGYNFRPWLDEKALADGPAILQYIKDTAKEGGYEDKIRYNHKITNANWSSEKSQWEIDITLPSKEVVSYTCGFLFACCGYYNYDAGYTPDYKNKDAFKGTFVHPQHWPEGLDYSDQKVVVIGSGATAVTIVPEMSKKAEKVTMLQRSPTYIMTVPGKDRLANFMNAVFPKKFSYLFTRWRKISMGLLFYKACRKWPKTLGRLLVKGMKKELEESNLENLDKHLTPRYNPWEQRLCAVPDGDLFESVKLGKADIVTDHIDQFTEKGILLQSGKELEADVIVSATGLVVRFLGGMAMSIDGKEMDTSERMIYRGMMFSDIPNMAQAFGYTNASWTLKCDLTCDYVCRLLNHMRKNNLKVVTPIVKDKNIQEEPLLDFNSGYVVRALDQLPKQGSKKPWKVFQNYFLDLISFKYSSLNDKALEYE